MDARSRRTTKAMSRPTGSDPIRGVARTGGLSPAEEEGIALLAELALDLCWSWSHATDALWRFHATKAFRCS
jgi:hypothetical protein